MASGPGFAVVSVGKAKPQWDASPPPGMMDLGPANLAGPGMGGGGGGSHNASPSLGPFRPFLPSVPATPHTLSTARAPDRDLAEAGVTGNGDAVPRTPDERRAQLQQWQNKMHAQFRKEMMGKHAADLPPLPLNGHQDSPLANANSQDVGKPYSQIQPSPRPGEAVPLDLRQTDGLVATPMALNPVTNGNPFAPANGGLRLDTSREALSPRSPALSGVSSPGSAPASPGYRFSASPGDRLAYSPGVDSPGSWRTGSASPQPMDTTNKSRETTAAEDVFGSGCFSCFACFGSKGQMDKSRALESPRSSRASSPRKATSPTDSRQARAHTSASRLQLGIVIAHFDDVNESTKKTHVVYGLTPDGAAQRSGRIQIGDKILSLNRENLAHVGGDAVKKKFKEAQRQNDHVLLALLRNGKELKFKIHLLANWYEENAHQHGRRSSSPTRSSRSSSPTRSRHGDSYAFPEQRPAQAHVAMNAMGMRNMNMDVPIIAQGDPLRRWQSPALPRIPGGRMFPTQSPFMGMQMGRVPSTQMSSRARTGSNAHAPQSRQQSPAPTSGRTSPRNGTSGRTSSRNGSRQESPRQRQRKGDRPRRQKN